MANASSADRLIRDWNRLPARLLDVRRKRLEKNEKFHFAGSSSAAFLLISRGKGDLTLGSDAVHSFDGAYAIHVSCHSELALTAEQETELYLFNYAFPGAYPDPISERRNESADLVFVPSDLLEIKHSFQLLLEQWHRMKALDQLCLMSHVYQSVHILLRQQQESEKTKTTNAADQRILRALRYMTGHLSRSMTLTEIAEQVGYANAYSFSRQFKQSCGISPEQYRRRDDAPGSSGQSDQTISSETAAWLSDLQAIENTGNEDHRLSANEARTTNVSSLIGAPVVRVPEPTRIVNTLMGLIEVPVRPRRIVTDWSIGHLLALGEQPIGAPSTLLDNGGLLDAYWNEGSADIGKHNEISHERILGLEPDLILTWNPEAYASYARIAPTLVFQADACNGMEDEMNLLGQWIGRKKEAAAWIRQARLRTHDLRSRLAARFAKSATFTLADPYWCGSRVTLIGNADYRGGRAVYDRLNLSLPSSLRHLLTSSGQDSARVDESELESNLGEWVLVMNYDASHNLTSAPQWNREAIAQRHRIVDLPWNRYFQSDPLSSLLQAEELTQMLDRPFSPF